MFAGARLLQRVYRFVYYIPQGGAVRWQFVKYKKTEFTCMELL